MKDGAAKAALATELFGRQGARLIPMLNEGSEGVQPLKKDFADLGGGYSPEFIEQSAKVEKENKRLGVGWAGLKTKIGAALLPAVIAIVNGLTKFVVWAQKAVHGTNA